MCNDLIVSNLSLSVSIGNAKKAVTALRTYGLTESEAIDLIAKETDIAINDYHIIPENAISPELIEMFGAQYVADCLPYVYHFMKALKIDWDLYKTAVSSLMDAFQMEEIAVSPEKIRLFLNNLNYMARDLQKKECGELSVRDGEPASPEYLYKMLEILKDDELSKITKMCESIYVEGSYNQV